MESNGEMGYVSYLTSVEAEKLCSILQSCDSSSVKDHLGTESSSQLEKHSQNEEWDSSDKHPPESKEVESLKEDWISYNRFMNKHRTRMEGLLPYLKRKPQDSSLEESLNRSKTKWCALRLWEDTFNDEIAFQKMLQEAELAIGSAEMLLPSFKETLFRITKVFNISASDKSTISMQEDLLVKELEAIEKIKGLLKRLLRASTEKEIISEQTEALVHMLTESEMNVLILCNYSKESVVLIQSLRNEVIHKEKHILELSTQLQQEKANLLKASRHFESVQAVQTHLQCQIEKKEAENNQLRAKFQTIENNIGEWKIQVGEYKQQILAEKERKVERRNALKRAAVVQKQRAKNMKTAVERLISKIKEKEIQLSEAFSASDIWKSHHKIIIDEKIKLEVHVETLKKFLGKLLSKFYSTINNYIDTSAELGTLNPYKRLDSDRVMHYVEHMMPKQITDLVMNLNRIQDDGRKSTNKIIQRLNSVASENEKVSLENTQLQAFLAVSEVNFISAEAELVNLHEEVHQQEKLVEQYTIEVGKLEMETEELKTRYEKVIHDSRSITEDRDFEINVMKSQTEARLKELEHVRDLQKAAEEKLQESQESLLFYQKSCIEKSKAIRELQIKRGDSDGFLKQLSLEEENCNIQLKYEEVKRKLEEMELQNKELKNRLMNQEDRLQKTELQYKQKLADYDALTRQLEAALEDGRKQLAEEMEKITSKEQFFQLKILDLENELRKKKKEKKELSKRLDAVQFLKTEVLRLEPCDTAIMREKNHEMSLKELERNLQRSENENQKRDGIYKQHILRRYIGKECLNTSKMHCSSIKKSTHFSLL